MSSDSEIRSDIGYNQSQALSPNTRGMVLRLPTNNAKRGSEGSQISRRELVKVHLIRGINMGHTYMMAVSFAEDLIRRGYAQRV